MSAIRFICDSHHGVYIPQCFAQDIARERVSGVSEDDWAILESGPDSEHYWDTWDIVIQNAVVHDGEWRYRLHQDSDLFLVCYELMTDEEYRDFME